MSELTPPAQATPFVTITPDAEGRLQLQTNIPPMQKPLILWFLEQARLMVLTQASQQEQAHIVPANGGLMGGMLKRMRP